MAKGYNNYNHLLTVQEACEWYEDYIEDYETVTEFYIKSFYPRFKKSRATMYNWLATPYKRELEKKQVGIQ